MSLRTLVPVVMALCAFQAKAEQRFYQVIDPDGHVRTITSSVPDSPAGDAGKAPALSPHQDTPPASIPPAATTSPVPASAPAKTWAPYDGDEYLDSEVLDSTAFNPEQKKNFYIIKDGMGVGSHVEERTADTQVPLFQQKPGVVPKSYGLPVEYQEIPGEQAPGKWLDIPVSCLPTTILRRAHDLGKGETGLTLFDRQALNFVHPRQVLESFRMPEPQPMRMLVLRAYASSKKNPAFSRPVVVLADEHGCISRVLTGYFQRRFEATETRYSMLEGELTLRPDERYVLVVVPVVGDQAETGAYRISRYGQFGVMWR